MKYEYGTNRVILTGQTKVHGGNPVPMTLSIINSTWPTQGSNPGIHGQRPMTDCLSYGMALMNISQKENLC